MFKLIIDYGKPSEEMVKDEDALRKRLAEIYEETKDEPIDVFVFRCEEEITESQFIEEMVAEVMGEDYNKETIRRLIK